jgi:hypothetical protein
MPNEVQLKLGLTRQSKGARVMTGIFLPISTRHPRERSDDWMLVNFLS